MVLGRKEARKSKRDEGEDLLNGWRTVVKLANTRKYLRLGYFIKPTALKFKINPEIPILHVVNTILTNFQ